MPHTAVHNVVQSHGVDVPVYSLQPLKNATLTHKHKLHEAHNRPGAGGEE
jgi:hypothetical protein